jgi:hypothetical protein
MKFHYVFCFAKQASTTFLFRLLCVLQNKKDSKLETLIILFIQYITYRECIVFIIANNIRQNWKEKSRD